MKSMMKKTTFREIKHSLGRYLAIFAIVALGVGFYTGLKVCKPSMVKTGDVYLKEHSLYDFRLLSTIGFEKDDIKDFLNLEDVDAVQTSVSVDAIFDAKDGTEKVFAVHTLLSDINTLSLVEGRMPEKPNECVLDAYTFKSDLIGFTFKLSKSNMDDAFDQFEYDEYTVVGLVNSPYYLNYERGNSSVGNGKINGYFYIPREGFSSEYETEMFITFKNDYEIYSDEYDEFIDKKKPEVEEILKNTVQKRYDKIYNDAKKELDDAWKEIEDGKRELEDAKKTLDEETASARKELEDALAKLQDGEEKLEAGKKELADARIAISDGELLISGKKKELEENLVQLDEGIQQVEAYILFSEEAKQTYEELMQKKALVQGGLSQIIVEENSLAAKRKLIEESEKELLNNEQEISDGYDSYYEGLDELEKNIKEANEEIDDATKELLDGEETYLEAKEEFDKLKEPNTYCLGRNTNTGYVCFENDTSIVDNIASVFPIFFFAVAALVCMTTMTRMVEDQRTQIGVLKALGYTNSRIAGKYLFYSGSAAIMGTIVGYIVFCLVFPKVIWIAYSMMYGFAPLIYELPVEYAVVSLIASGLCSVGTTYVSCASQFTDVPSNLIRPKAPKAGKRILLERIGFIWKNLSFLRKVSIRNVFRYKKRFFMMILGISGCTALLLTGFGLGDSIKGVLKSQYNNISTYDINVNFLDPVTDDNISSLDTIFGDFFESYSYFADIKMDISNERTTRTLSICIPVDEQAFTNEFHLLDTNTSGELPFPNAGEVIITEKAASKLGLKIGDEFTLSDNDLNVFTVKLVGICKNYVYEYGFMTKETYENCIGKKPEYKSLYGTFLDELDGQKASAKILDLDEVSNISLNKDFMVRFDNMIGSLDYIIVMVIICAAALAFIVLYNLTNINITERIREIATIKVLGFYSSETASYVFRENIVLTAIGALFGLVLGRLLHIFVMSRIDIALIYFGYEIKAISFIWSILLTFLFALLVNFVMYFKLEKINMAESLKSIE